MKKIFYTLLFLGSVSVSFAQGGGLDFFFGTGGKVVNPLPNGFNGYNADMELLPDGKILILYTTYDMGDWKVGLFRYLPDGTPDVSFGSGGVVSPLPLGYVGTDLLLLPDGKLILALWSTQSGLERDFALARLNADGSLDDSFGTAGFASVHTGRLDEGVSVARQPDGKLVLGGSSGDENTNLADFAAVRFLADGTLDQGFGDNGIKRVTFPGIYKVNNAIKVLLLPSGRILLAGKALTPSNSSFAMVQLLADGSLDNSFSGDGIEITGITSTFTNVADALLLSSGKILMLGALSSSNEFTLVRFNVDGSLDNTFGTFGMAASSIPFNIYSALSSMSLQSDGKIVSGGYYTDLSTQRSEFLLVRHTPEGMLDQAFGTGGYVRTQIADSNGLGTKLLVQPDQKIILSGSAAKAGETVHAMARYLPGQLSVENIDALGESVRVYPNPTHDNPVLSFTLNNTETLSIDLVDMNGKIRASFLNGVSKAPGQYSESLNLPAGLVAGIYYLRLSSPNGHTVVPFVKQ